MSSFGTIFAHTFLMSISSVKILLTEDIDMRKVCTKMFPKELIEEQKQRRVFSY